MPGSSSSKTARHCPQCGAALRASASFCTTCGAAIAGPAQAPAARSKAQTKRSSGPWLAIAIVVALVAVVAIALALNSNSQETANVPAAIPTVAAAQDVPYPNVARVSPENAHMSAMSGEAVIVDVRGQEFYDAGHARGAISLPLDQLPARFSELPQDQAVLFYCT